MYNDMAGPNPTASVNRPWPRRREHSDEALIEKVAAGNRLAMQVLFARHHVRVYRFVLRIVGNDAVAEDVTSEVFLSVWRQAHRFEARSAVTTWIWPSRVTRRSPSCDTGPRRRSTTRARKPAIRRTIRKSCFQDKHRGEILRRCMTQLPREHREIIDLVYYHEKSVQEVAEILGIPGNTVKTRMFYARRKLSELLATQGIVEASS